MPQTDPEARRRYNREYRERNLRTRSQAVKLGEKDLKLRRLYGITLLDWQWMFMAQGGLCAIAGCSSPATDTDHDHATGQVRALLCHPHNTSLHHSFAPSDLRAMADYLEAHGG